MTNLESVKGPLYRQLHDLLRREIDEGKYQPGQRFPTESELTETYGVSRITVRNALKELTRENYLIRYRGRGSYVSQKKMHRSLNIISSFTQVCEQMGCRPGARVMKCQLEEATPEDMRELDLQPGAKVLSTERVRFADDVPVSFEINRFTEDFDFLLYEDLNNCSMYALLKDKYNITFAHSQKTIELTYASYETAKYLRIPSGYPLLSIASVVSSMDGKKSHCSLQLIVGDKFKLII